jgi:hypothetical protein
LGSVRGKVFLENLGVDGKVILKWNVVKKFGRGWVGFFSLRTATGGGGGAVVATVIKLRNS